MRTRAHHRLICADVGWSPFKTVVAQIRSFWRGVPQALLHGGGLGLR